MRLTSAGAHDLLQHIRKKYCTNKNRQHTRTRVGDYYLGGASEVNPDISQINIIDQCTATVLTKPLNLKNQKGHRFTLQQIGGCWRIANLENNAGLNRWNEGSL